MTNNATSFNDYFRLPNQGLRAYFSLVERGQPEEYRTTFYKGRSLAAILDGWDQIMSSSGLANEWPTLVEFENDLRKKVGPMSIMKPLSERMNDIDAYYSGISSPRKPISQDAISQLFAEWSEISGLRIRSQLTTVDAMKKSTNSGSPFFTKRSHVLDQTLPVNRVFMDGDNCYQILGNGEVMWQACAVLGWRGQEGGPKASDVKQRVVWMFPFAVNIVELQVYQPLIHACQRKNLVPAWVSMEAVDERITELFDTKGKDDLIVCTDFTKFDQHFNSTLQTATKQILSRLFKGDEAIGNWIEDCFPIKYRIPLAISWENVRYGEHGMGSGSGGTNADETIAHRILQHEAALRANSKLNLASQCLGDDGVLSFPGCTVEAIVDTYTSHGLEMNLDKQYSSTDDCTYLRRWHHKDYRSNGICVGVYSTFRALGRLCEQERFYDSQAWGPKAVALRQLSILENIKFHPLREKFVDYCMKGDKYRLGLDIPDFLGNVEREAMQVTKYMPDFLGYTKSFALKEKEKRLNSWWIVNYLKSLA